MLVCKSKSDCGLSSLLLYLDVYKDFFSPQKLPAFLNLNIQSDCFSVFPRIFTYSRMFLLERRSDSFVAAGCLATNPYCSTMKENKNKIRKIPVCGPWHVPAFTFSIQSSATAQLRPGANAFSRCTCKCTQNKSTLKA